MKKTDSYNKYVPLFIDNYAEQRSAKLRARMGWAGYGIYLAILQRLRSEKDCVLELDYETLAFSFWTDEDTLRSIIEDFGLFVIDRKNRTFSSPLLEEMLRTIDPALSKSRNKRYSLQVSANEDTTHDVSAESEEKAVSDDENSMEYPANEDITHDISGVSEEKAISVVENSMEYPANEDITHDISGESEEKAVSADENSMEYPANEDITHDISGVSEEKAVSADENSMEYPANEDITSSPRTCVCVNKQTNKQTNKRKKREEKSSPFPHFFRKGRRVEKNRRREMGKLARLRVYPPRMLLILANARVEHSQKRFRCL